MGLVRKLGGTGWTGKVGLLGQVLLIESLVTRAGEKEMSGWKTDPKERLLKTDDDGREKVHVSLDGTDDDLWSKRAENKHKPVLLGPSGQQKVIK
jgi:hypothetical protein